MAGPVRLASTSDVVRAGARLSRKKGEERERDVFLGACHGHVAMGSTPTRSGLKSRTPRGRANVVRLDARVIVSGRRAGMSNGYKGREATREQAWKL